MSSFRRKILNRRKKEVKIPDVYIYSPGNAVYLNGSGGQLFNASSDNLRFVCICKRDDVDTPNPWQSTVTSYDRSMEQYLSALPIPKGATRVVFHFENPYLNGYLIQSGINIWNDQEEIIFNAGWTDAGVYHDIDLTKYPTAKWLFSAMRIKDDSKASLVGTGFLGLASELIGQHIDFYFDNDTDMDEEDYSKPVKVELTDMEVGDASLWFTNPNDTTYLNLNVCLWRQSGNDRRKAVLVRRDSIKNPITWGNQYPFSGVELANDTMSQYSLIPIPKNATSIRAIHTNDNVRLGFGIADGVHSMIFYNTGWIYAGTETTVDLTQYPDGKYITMIIGTNPDGDSAKPYVGLAKDTIGLSIEFYVNRVGFKDGEPKFGVTEDISTYSGDLYRNVYDSTSGKWYELNDSDEYEEYGVVEIVQSLDDTTKYLGKKVLTMDSHLYEWNGKIWIDYGVATRDNPTKQYIVLPVPENNKVFASKADMEAYDRPWVGMIAYVGSDEYRYNESFKWQSTASWIEVETGQWIESTKTVDGYTVYMSNSNKGVNSGWAYVKVRWSGIPDFKMYLCSYAEGTFDFSIAYALDNEKTTQLLNTSGFQKDPSAGISSFKECSYPNDGGEHFAWVAYKKDGSVNNYDDRGYLAIPNEYM